MDGKEFLEFLLNVLCFWTLVSFVSEYHISCRGQSWGWCLGLFFVGLILGFFMFVFFFFFSLVERILKHLIRSYCSLSHYGLVVRFYLFILLGACFNTFVLELVLLCILRDS